MFSSIKAFLSKRNAERLIVEMSADDNLELAEVLSAEKFYPAWIHPDLAAWGERVRRQARLEKREHDLAAFMKIKVFAVRIRGNIRRAVSA